MLGSVGVVEPLLRRDPLCAAGGRSGACTRTAQPADGGARARRAGRRRQGRAASPARRDATPGPVARPAETAEGSGAAPRVAQDAARRSLQRQSDREGQGVRDRDRRRHRKAALRARREDATQRRLQREDRDVGGGAVAAGARIPLANDAVDRRTTQRPAAAGGRRGARRSLSCAGPAIRRWRPRIWRR